MKIKLLSDFRDYYDMFFDHEGEIFRRFTTDGLNRPEMMDYLCKLGFATPTYGLVKNLKLDPKSKIVLHNDINAHRGNGKELMVLEDAMKTNLNTFATEFIKFEVPEMPVNTKGLSWRYLQVGKETFWLEYTSIEDWRSNCGEGDIKLMFRDKTELFPDYNYEKLKFKYPLFAIDFIPTEKILYAVDFNISPGCSPIKDVLSPMEAVNSIKKAYTLLKKEM